MNIYLCNMKIHPPHPPLSVSSLCSTQLVVVCICNIILSDGKSEVHLPLLLIAPKYAGGSATLRENGCRAVYEVGAVGLQEVGHSTANICILFHLPL
jgi:hypothetical protein